MKKNILIAILFLVCNGSSISAADSLQPSTEASNETIMTPVNQTSGQRRGLNLK
jgi:hypothetical protein